MRILVIGGTAFLGRWVVIEALTRAHDVTVFHRGLHNHGLFPQVETLVGNRDGDLAALRGRTWDAVVDTCGYAPGPVELTARALADRVDHYSFVSSVAAYRHWPQLPIDDEDAPLHLDVDDAHGPLKAACERALEAVMPGRVLHVRLGAVVGPHEYYGRLPWWLARMEAGGPVLAPGPRQAPIQLVDARDAAAFILDMAEQRSTGAYNVASEPHTLAWGDLLEACADAVGDVRLVWLDGERVAAALEDPWESLPLWPVPIAAVAGMNAVGVRRALEAGLTIRPLAETAADTWDLLKVNGLPDYLPELRVAGLDPRREAVLLAALGPTAA